MTEKINQSDFTDWKDHPVTKEVFRNLQALRSQINDELINAHVLLGPNNEKTVPRLVGYREGIDALLQVTYEDIGVENVEG